MPGSERVQVQQANSSLRCPDGRSPTAKGVVVAELDARRTRLQIMNDRVGTSHQRSAGIGRRSVQSARRSWSLKSVNTAIRGGWERSAGATRHQER